MPDENILTPETDEAFPHDEPTPEQIAEWERERQEAWDAKLKPARDAKAQRNEHDDLIAEALFELTMLEFGE